MEPMTINTAQSYNTQVKVREKLIRELEAIGDEQSLKLIEQIKREIELLKSYRDYYRK